MEDKGQIDNKTGCAEAVLYLYPDRLQNNLKQIQERTGRPVIAVVKQDGYGLGLPWMSRCLYEAGQRAFAAAKPEEVLCLRRLFPDAELLLLTPVSDVQIAQRLLSANVQMMIGSLQDAELLQTVSRQLGRIPQVQIKLDTGLGRFGFTADNLPQLPAHLQGLCVKGCYTHITGQNDRKLSGSLAQFQEGVRYLRRQGVVLPMTHIGGSYAALHSTGRDCTALRLGSALLGCTAKADAWNLQPCFSLQTPIVRLSDRHKGETVGYGRQVILHHDTRVGLLPVGHAQGVFLCSTERQPNGLQLLKSLYRRFRNESVCVYRDGKPLRVLGGVGMGHSMIALDETAQIGDFIEIPVNPLLLRSDIRRHVTSERIRDEQKE